MKKIIAVSLIVVMVLSLCVVVLSAQTESEEISRVLSLIKERIGEGNTVPMYGFWENIKDLERDWCKLPERFVLKSNLMANSSGVLIIKEKSKIKFSEIKKEVRGWLKQWNTLLNSWDWHFYNSTPKILAEKYMEDDSGELRDYKFFCFDGNVPYFRVDYGRSKQHHATFFNSKFEEVDISVPDFPKENDVTITLPNNIEEMYNIAKSLSKGFPFIRIDFFSCNNKWYLSEFTFAPGGGTTHYPAAFNKELGDMFHLPK